MNLERVVDAIPPLPPNAHVLEIGAGHGEVTNVLLARYPTLRVTMQELAPTTGYCLEPAYRSRVRLLPATPLDAPAISAEHYDAILITDVMHHVPQSERAGFLADVAALIDGQRVALVFKDIRPGRLRSVFSVLADRYITGDRHVSLMPQADLEALVRASFPHARIEPTRLDDVDPPNYAFVAWV